MSPKSLSEQEKSIQKKKMFAKGRELLSSYGVRKTSVQDIAKAANMAKGSFYQYFDSKEAFFFELIFEFHSEWFQNAGEALVQHSTMPLEERVRAFIRLIFHSPEFLSVFKYHDELEELMQHMSRSSKERVDALMQMEHAAYDNLLKLCNMDTCRVKPGVVHNYLHAIYFSMSNASLMEQEHILETFEALLDGLIAYIFGGGK